MLKANARAIEASGGPSLRSAGWPTRSRCPASSTPTATRSSVPGPRRRRRLLGLAGADAGGRRPADAGKRPRALRPHLRGDARRRLHGGRRVPLPRRRGGARCAQAAADAGVEIVLLLAAYARGGLARMRQQSPADYLRQLESLREDGTRSGSPPTPSVRARAIGSRSLAATRRPSGFRSISTPASSRARSRSASPSTAAGRSSSCPAPAARPHVTVVHATHANGDELDCSPRAARPSAPARRPRPTSRTASSRRPESSTAGSRFRSAPTRT